MAEHTKAFDKWFEATYCQPPARPISEHDRDLSCKGFLAGYAAALAAQRRAMSVAGRVPARGRGIAEVE